MASRLDRLFVLLETGSTGATRKAAAGQLGEVQRLHPHELPSLLSRVHKCLRAQNWETRVAAGQAVEAILCQVPQWAPHLKIKAEKTLPETPSECEDDPSEPKLVIHDDEGTKARTKPKLTFDKFDVSHLLDSGGGSFLMASDVKVFEHLPPKNNGEQDPTSQRNLINKRLGLDIAGVDTSDIVSNDDLQQAVENDQTQSQMDVKKEKKVVEKLHLFDPSLEDQLSSREINLAKRRARKQRSREMQAMEGKDPCSPGGTQGQGSSPKKLRRDDLDLSMNGDSNRGLYVTEEGDWPLSSWVDVLMNDVFSPMWEVRHGAATALRETIKIHGRGGGRQRNMTLPESELAHKEWLEDLALRLVSVLALDRFGDFVSDQVVAPVRETCAQCLGTAVTLMDSEGVTELVRILVQMLSHSAWEARHGALLALKYIFAVRRDLMKSLLPMCFSLVFQCLGDSVDDVTAVAASSLIPVADLLVEILPSNTPSVVNLLWDSLADLDDLSSACNSIMGLLATLLAFPKARTNLKELDVLMPRLWAFMHHTSSSVRKSALLTLQKLTELDMSITPMSTQPLQETLRHVYQRGLVEHQREVQTLIPMVWADLLRCSKLETLLLAACPLFSTWLCLAMQPARLPFDPTYLVPRGNKKKVKAGGGKTATVENGAAEDVTSNGPEGVTKVYMGGSAEGDPNIIATTRLHLAKMLGQLAFYIVQPLPTGVPAEEPIEIFVRVLLVHLNSRSALQRTVCSLVVSAWPNSQNNDEKGLGRKSHPGLCSRLRECLGESIYFDEIALGYTKLQSECKDFLATLKHYKVELPRDIEALGGNSLLNFAQIENLSGQEMTNRIRKHLKKPKVSETLLDRQKSIFNLWSSTTAEFSALNIMTMAALSSAVCSMGSNCLPAKLNPVVKPLMDAIRREENCNFQMAAADHLPMLMEMVISRDPCPNPKIIQNLTTYLCSATPHLNSSTSNKILSLATLTGLDSTGSSSSSSKKALSTEEQAEAETNKWLQVQKRGAVFALSAIVTYFGEQLPEKVPKLWEVTFGVLSQCAGNREQSTEVVSALQVLETISPYFHKQLFSSVEKQIERLCVLLTAEEGGVRHMASRCLAVWASLMSEKVMPLVAVEVVPRLDASHHELSRQGAIEAIWCIVDKLGLSLLPYIVLLVVPVLGRMSDLDEEVRLLASLTFATLVRLMPLEGGVPDPPNLPAHLLKEKGEQREFLEQLLNPSKIPEYRVTVPINAELRPYQQAGINWLGFLNKFKLHGILCDDMGLGKTLQSICVLASDHKERMEKYEKSESADCLPLPSIVVCPPTLTGHWVYEVEKFISSEFLHPLHYHGPPSERNKLKSKLPGHNLVIASYDIVRNDIDFFSSIRWNYCILDEGHIIKNGKTKISKAIKQLRSNHRLILSGTPIQNNVLELWSLFDFLMPGFLGTEKQFSLRFARPILLARDPKSSPKEQEAGALAMEALHRQALPFLLRRLKEDVLQDLPPKITQDYYCELSSIQEQLYDDFARTKAHQSLRDTFTQADDPSKHSHIFQALQYLRKVCNHPKLVLTAQHPKYNSIMSSLQQNKSTLDDISHSAKLPALKQLLLDCGIGVTESSANPDSISVVSQHRALIFCQLKVMLDILEHDFFKVHMPSVTYLRLDGSVPAGQRHSLVTRFNNDPSIDLLLLTTQVGGLGLNLTGADTVIFVEHDWNPMRDLQAMDRAHRIGQKKVVNVYRLITRGTLEEKIMGLQKFKLMTANTVISQENASMETMATDQLLDLFVLEDGKEGKPSSEKNEDVGGIVGAYKNVMENLPELWEDKLYEEEYDLSTFIKNLGK